MNMKLNEYAKKILLSGPSKYSTSDPELFKRVNQHSRVDTGIFTSCDSVSDTRSCTDNWLLSYLSCS